MSYNCRFSWYTRCFFYRLKSDTNLAFNRSSNGDYFNNVFQFKTLFHYIRGLNLREKIWTQIFFYTRKDSNFFSSFSVRLFSPVYPLIARGCIMRIYRCVRVLLIVLKFTNWNIWILIVVQFESDVSFLWNKAANIVIIAI